MTEFAMKQRHDQQANRSMCEAEEMTPEKIAAKILNSTGGYELRHKRGAELIRQRIAKLEAALRNRE